MVIGFRDKIYHKYNYIYNIIGGIFLLIFSVIVLLTCRNIIFSGEIIDFNSYLTRSNVELNQLIHKKVSVRIYNCYGMYYHEVSSNNSTSDYYIIELEDGSLMALQTDPSKGNIFQKFSEKTLSSSDSNQSHIYYEHVGYLRKFDGYTNDLYQKYIRELKEKKYISDDVVVREFLVNNENDRFWIIICLIMGVLSGAFLLIIGIKRLRDR